MVPTARRPRGPAWVVGRLTHEALRRWRFPDHADFNAFLFPHALSAGLIDRVIVNKSFTPDLPGNSTGGGVNIITKSFPEKGTLNLSVGSEFNTATTGNGKFLSYRGGGTDWLATDDGTRARIGRCIFWTTRDRDAAR